MSYTINKRESISHKLYAIQPGEIVVKLSSIILLVLAALAIRVLTYLWPKDGELPPTVFEMLLSLISSPKIQPSLIGAMLSFLSWHVFYIDSAVPGINPPTPLSSAKYRKLSGADFHLNFVFAILIGPLVATFLYLDWV